MVEPPFVNRAEFQRLGIPRREGRHIYVLMPDGTRIEMDALAAADHMRQWAEIIGGALVATETGL